MTSDVVTALRRHLATKNDLKRLLHANDKYDTFIFRWRPREPIMGSGKSSVTISQRGGWATPNQHNTLKFPRIQIEVRSDPDRDADGQLAIPNAEDKVQKVYEVVDKYLHRPAGGEIEWDDLRVIGTLRLGEPDISLTPDTDQEASLLVFYGVNLG